VPPPDTRSAVIRARERSAQAKALAERSDLLMKAGTLLLQSSDQRLRSALRAPRRAPAV
jgi:hypothetical protein